MFAGDYLGGHPAHESGAQHVSLHLDDDGAAIRRSRPVYANDGWIARYEAPFVRIPLSEIESVEVDGQDAIEARVATHRLARTGVFAPGFLKHKRDTTSYVTIKTSAGDVVFRVEDEEPRQVGTKIAEFRAGVRDARTAAGGARLDARIPLG